MNWSEAYWFLGARSPHWRCHSPLVASTNPIIFGPRCGPLCALLRSASWTSEVYRDGKKPRPRPSSLTGT